MSRFAQLLAITAAAGIMMAEGTPEQQMLENENKFRRKSYSDDKVAAELRAKRKAAKQAAWDKRNRGR